MRKPKRAQPRLESLEEKALLSQISPLRMPARPVSAFVGRRMAPFAFNAGALQGTVHGEYTAAPGPRGVPANYVLYGSGSLAKAASGEVSVQGVITTNRVRGASAQTGFITLTGANGTIRMRVQSNRGLQPLQATAASGTSSQAELRFNVINATGIYRNLRGTGTLTLTLTPSQTVVPPSEEKGPVAPGGGTPSPSDPSTGAGGGGKGGGIITPPPSSPISPGVGSTRPRGPGVGPGGFGPGVGARAVDPTPTPGPTVLNGQFVMVFNRRQNIL